MTIPERYDQRGRTEQKRRTRDALIEAARDLIVMGKTPTVEAAAKGSAISRTTAYRYFPTQRALLAAAHPETERKTLLPLDAPSDPRARLELVIDAIARILLKTEAQQRTMLRLSLDQPVDHSALPLRQGRAIGWIEDALRPLRSKMSPAKLKRLVFAVRTAIGIEALVWLTDVAALSRRHAISVMRWSALALLQTALDTDQR